MRRSQSRIARETTASSRATRSSRARARARQRAERVLGGDEVEAAGAVGAREVHRVIR
jgi:hypothetical protein